MKTMMMGRNLVTNLSGPRYAIEVAKELAELGNQVFVPTSNARTQIENVRILELPKAFGRRMISPIAYSVYAKIARIKFGVEIVHGNGYSLFDDVTTVHFQTRPFEERFRRFITTHISSGLGQIAAERTIWKSSKHLIAVSNMVKEDLIRFYGVDADKISVVHNGVTLDEFSPSEGAEKEKLLRKHGLSSDKVLLLFVGGSAYERKGFKFLLDTLPYLSQDVVVVAICRNLAQNYLDLISRSNARNNLIIEPYVQDISEVYKAVDMYILPTIYDPFPLAVLEAMASRLPVIVSSLSGTVDIIRSRENGVIVADPSNAIELSNAINTLAGSEKMRKRMASNARVTVERMSWKEVAKQVLDVYEMLTRR